MCVFMYKKMENAILKHKERTTFVMVPCITPNLNCEGTQKQGKRQKSYCYIGVEFKKSLKNCKENVETVR